MSPEEAGNAIRLPDEVTNARQRAADLVGTAGQYSAAEPTISDLLREKVMRAYADNADIVSKLDESTTNYISAPSQAREQYQDIFNPFQREALVSRYTSNAALPMLSLSNIYGNRMGRIDDTIGAGTRAFQAAVQQKALVAQQAQQEYESVLNEYRVLEDLRARQRAEQFQQTQFDYQKTQDQRDFELKLKQLAQSGSGGNTKRSTSLVTIGGRQKLIDTQTGEIIQDLGAESDPSELRKSLASDVIQDSQNGLDREQSMRENRALYPELDEGTFNSVYDTIWQAPEPAQTSFNINSALERLYNWISPNQLSYQLAK